VGVSGQYDHVTPPLVPIPTLRRMAFFDDPSQPDIDPDSDF
jgi:hypothetical protein